MTVQRKVCLEYTNLKGEQHKFFQGDMVVLFVGEDVLIGRLKEIWVDYVMIDCSIDYVSNIVHISFNDIDEVLNYDDYKEIQPLM